MIPLERCKKILNKGKRKYREEEIIKIREFLYFVAEIKMEPFTIKSEGKDKNEKKMEREDYSWVWGTLYLILLILFWICVFLDPLSFQDWWNVEEGLLPSYP